MLKFGLVVLSLLIVGCGGSSEEATNEPSNAQQSVPAKANNPLAAEQQLIKDAEALQGVLNTDAERKKKAVEDAN